MNTVRAADVDDVTIDLGVILRALRRAWLTVGLGTVLVAALSFVGLSLLPPSYKSNARVVIETRDVPLGQQQRQGEAERAVLDEQGIGSQVQLILSRDNARRVIAALRLTEDPEFVSGGRLQALLGLVGLGREGGGSLEEKVLETFYEHLEVFPTEKTRVIQVEFSSRDPATAAKIATAIVEQYLGAAVEAKGRNSVETTKVLSGEIEQLRKRVAEAEAKVEQYRAGADLFVGQNNVKISEQQLGELNSQLTATKAQRSETEARVRQLKRLIETGAALETAPEVSSSPIVQRLKELQVGLKARAAELATTYLPNHPQVQTVNAQIADVTTQVRAEAAKVLAGYENELKVADGRVKQLGAQLNEFKSQAARAGEEDIQLRALEREAKVQRDQLEAFLTQYRGELAKQAAGAQTADARLISAATVPQKPSFPKVVPLTIAITLATFLAMCTWIVLREFLTGNVLRPVTSGGETTAESVPVPPTVPVATVPTAGAVPIDGRVSAPRLEATEIAGLLPHDGRSAREQEADASLERIWGEIATEAVDGQRIVVSSATSDHAAHVAALTLLRVAAKRGAKVCLVGLVDPEGDLADLLDEDDMPGLTELLAGEARFADIIFRDPASRGHVVLGGRSSATPIDLAGDELVGALEALDLTYDHVILDLGLIAAAPGVVELVGSADTLVLAADGAGSDPRTNRAHEALTTAGLASVRVLAVDHDEVKSVADVAA